MMELNHYFQAGATPVVSTPKRSAIKMSTPEMWWHSAAVGIQYCLAPGPPNCFTACDLYHEIPAINEIYQSPRTLGDRLGRGVAGHGLGLYRDPRSGFLKCRENATLFLLGACHPDFISIRARLAAGDTLDNIMLDGDLDVYALEDVARAAGFKNADALAAAIRTLPSAHDGLSNPTEVTVCRSARDIETETLPDVSAHDG